MCLLLATNTISSACYHSALVVVLSTWHCCTRRHEVYDTKADVWSWGVLLIEALTLSQPYVTTYMTPVQVRRSTTKQVLYCRT